VRDQCAYISFFFQAEDGIRDFHVTGVQTCALPIFANRQWEPGMYPVDEVRPVPLGLRPSFGFGDRLGLGTAGHIEAMRRAGQGRSEERRVGKEWSTRWEPGDAKKKKDGQRRSEASR